MDIELYSESFGEGFPLILLHGNGEDGRYFKNQTGFFAARYRVITVDTRGHGKSPRGSLPFSLAQFAEDFKCFMDEKGIKKAHILGFSDGANIALLFALKYPDMIEKLILNGADLDPKGVKLLVQAPVVLGYGVLRFISLLDKKAVPKKEMLEIMFNQPHIKPAELSTLKLPVLVIAGTRDMIKDSHTRLIAASIPGAELSIIEGTHFIAKENSVPFNARVAEFLDK